MVDSHEDITPDEIRRIRTRLSLSQVKAGEVFGGGPRAFTKYEAGTTKPTSSTVRLLRLLDVNPSLLRQLSGSGAQPPSRMGPSPFEVNGDDIARLSEHELPELLRRLLNAEAFRNALPADSIHVAANIYMADGGEDGRISWEAGPPRTTYLPSRLCQFQLKAGPVPPARAGKEVLTRKGEIKGMVAAVLQQGGNYIVLCGHKYAAQHVEERRERILESLRGASLPVEDGQVDFRDASEIADWVNEHASVALWVKDRTQPGTVGPFRPWSHWASRKEHRSTPYIEDDRLPVLRAELRKRVATPKGVARVVGLAGIGKSRLVLEALGNEQGEDHAVSISDTVMYAVVPESSTGAVIGTVQALADAGTRAVVVIDECDPETHGRLSGIVQHDASNLSLVTIDNDLSDKLGSDAVLDLAPAANEISDALIRHLSPDLPAEDQRRLGHFSGGYPRVAIQVAEAWGRSTPIAHATADDLVDAFILGRAPRDSALLLETGELLAALGQVRLDPSDSNRLEQMASLSRGRTPQDIHVAVVDLVGRSIAQSRGRIVRIQPRPIALRLAERQWGNWLPETWDRVLAGDIKPELKVTAAQHLALLNTTDIGQKVVRHVCRVGGPLDGIEGITQPGHAEVLSALAEVSPEEVAQLLRRSLAGCADLREVVGNPRRHLVWASEKLAFANATFAEGANLLLELAVAENEPWGNNATDQFSGLFSLYLGGTEADGDERLDFLDKVMAKEDQLQLEIVVQALANATNVSHFFRAVGPEVHGSRPALESWQPTTRQEMFRYVDGCVERLAQLATRDDTIGEAARSVLGENLRSLIAHGYLDGVEHVVSLVAGSVGYWHEARRSLHVVLAYDSESMSPDAVERIEALAHHLRPEGFQARVRASVTELPIISLRGGESDFGDRYTEQFRQHEADASQLASELCEHPEVLTELLPQISCGQQHHAFAFGRALGSATASGIDRLATIVESLLGVPTAERNFDLLAGYVVGLAQTQPNAVEEFKQTAASNGDIAYAFLLASSRLGVTASDIELAIEALRSGALNASQLRQWGYGGVLGKLSPEVVAPLIDALIDHGAQGVAVALDLMGMYALDDLAKLDSIQPQLLKAAENIRMFQTGSGPSVMESFYFEKLMGHVLGKGRDDPFAAELALTLAQALATANEFEVERLLEPLLPTLLANFPEVVWPLLGNAAIADARNSFHMRSILGNLFFAKQGHTPPILSLPEATLFAWCYANPEKGPAFAAEVLPVLAPASEGEESGDDRSIHPVMLRMLEEFGDREDVQRAIESNMSTFIWQRSTTVYYSGYEAPLKKLLDHPKMHVRHWARRVLRRLDTDIERAQQWDEELDAWHDL